MVMEVMPAQPRKAASPILVTLLGMVMEVSPEVEKASTPILVTLLGIVMEVSLEQPEYLQLVVYQLIYNKTVEK